MLQAIAIAQLNAAGLGKGDADDMVYDEVTEQYEPGKWPHVHDNDWCGEWKSDDNRFGVVHSGGLRVRADELAAKEAKLAEIRAKEKTA